MGRDGNKSVFLNDRWVTPEEAVVSIEDRGFQLGDGVYEVVRVYDGEPFALQPHLDRLARSAAEIQMTLPEPSPPLADIVRQAPGRRGLREAQVYMQVTRGHAPRTHHFPADPRPTLTVYASPAPVQPPEAYADGVKAIIVPDERWLRCDIKSVMLLANGIAKEQARRAGAVEALLEREGVGMTEGSSSNLFLVKGGRLVTAPPGRYILRGITRDIVLDLARQGGIEVEERFFSRQELLAADEVFVTSTNIEVLPLRQVDDAVIGDGRVGPVTRQLVTAYKETTVAARLGESRS